MIAAREERITKPFHPESQAASLEARALRRRVWGLAAPVIGENFLETLLGIVDTLLVAGLGSVAIAGVGSALQIMFFLISALSALAIGSSVLVAQAVGGGDTAHASRLGRQSLICVSFSSKPPLPAVPWRSVWLPPLTRSTTIYRQIWSLMWPAGHR